MNSARTLLSFEDYVAYDDGTASRYELVDGALVEQILAVGVLEEEEDG